MDTSTKSHKLTPDQSASRRRSTQQAYTLIELLAVMFIVTVMGAVGGIVASKYGTGLGIGAAFLAALGAVFIVVLLYRRSWRKDRRRLQELKDNYQGIYRVLAVPSDQRSVMKPEGAEIKLGDFGWEAGSIRKDGLVYLPGLTVEWNVVWYAGFKPDQIERVATKPCSQYGHWVPYWAKKPVLSPCPFPVVDRETPTIGRPHPSHRIIEIPTLYRPKRAAGAE
jgi:prepilin-type N-terminal cleavage/methylation domain-containing protein